MGNFIVVEGKKVDLDKATLLGSYQYGSGRGDFNYVYEDIYKTERGNFVFVGEGGAGSKYGEKIATNTTSGGERKYFLDKDRVIELLEKWGEEKSLLENFNDDLELA